MSARRLLALGLTAMALALAAGASVQALPAGRVSGAPPTVQSMIVGSAGAILSPARTVTAVLAAMRRAGGPGFALRDYGHCGASPKDSAELFVDSLAGEANSGQDGWEYKVDSVAGSTGAADTSGPMGDGRRLSSGQRVLWFWCNATGGGCQRTLEVAPSTLAVSPGASLTVTVTGYENEGRGTPIGGASVALGLHTATTSASRGLVPSFPETIVVR